MTQEQGVLENTEDVRVAVDIYLTDTMSLSPTYRRNKQHNIWDFFLPVGKRVLSLYTSRD